MVKLIRSEELLGFHIKKWPPGHGATQFDTWLNATAPYNITFQKVSNPSQPFDMLF